MKKITFHVARIVDKTASLGEDNPNNSLIVLAEDPAHTISFVYKGKYFDNDFYHLDEYCKEHGFELTEKVFVLDFENETIEKWQ